MNKVKGILFLDMDGVLCTPRMSLTKDTPTLDFLDPVCVALLDKFCQKHELNLVCSSAWRFKTRVPDILRTHGMSTFFVSRNLSIDEDKEEYYICNTPRHDLSHKDTSRGAEILHWLDDHSSIMEDPNRFIIFDDEITDIISHDRLKGHVVKCDAFNGITYEAYKEAEHIICSLS